MKIEFFIIESLLISLAFTSKPNEFYFTNGEEKKISIEKDNMYYFFVEGVSQNQEIKMTIKTSDDDTFPFASVNYKGTAYIAAAIFEYDKFDKVNDFSFYYKLDIEKEYNYWVFSRSIDVNYYNTEKVRFNITANYTTEIKVKLEYGGNTYDIEKGKEFTFFNITGLYPYYFYVNATDGEVINAEVTIYDFDNETKIVSYLDVYEERNSPKRSIILLKPSTVLEEKDYLKLNYTYYINHPFDLNVKSVAFHIFPHIDIREMKVKLNTENKDKDKNNDKSNDKSIDKENDEKQNSNSLFIIIAIIILIVIILIIAFIILRLKASKNSKDIYSLNIEAPSTPLTPQNQNNTPLQQQNAYPQYIGLNSPQIIPPQEMYTNPIQPIQENNNMNNYIKPSQIYQ